MKDLPNLTLKIASFNIQKALTAEQSNETEFFNLERNNTHMSFSLFGLLTSPSGAQPLFKYI